MDPSFIHFFVPPVTCANVITSTNLPDGVETYSKEEEEEEGGIKGTLGTQLDTKA